MRRQRTVAHAIGCVGVGLHSGARVGLTLRPAPAGSGVRFRRTDRPGHASIAAHLDHAVALPESTGLGERGIPRVRAVERLMAALSACLIDNALVEISGPELPAMDGSALPFVLLIECAGVTEQEAPAAVLEVVRPVEVVTPAGMARIEPSPGFELVVSAPDVAAAGPFHLVVTPESCRAELVAARGRGAGQDARHAGAASPGSAEEAVRHRALGALGDLALVPARLCARYVEHGADHALRHDLLRALLADRRAWRGTAGAGLMHFVATEARAAAGRVGFC